MSEGMLAAITGVAALVFTALQWWFAHRAATQQRDAEMTHWAGEVIDLMAELETLCSPISPENKFAAGEAETISYRASALIDRGRLFFRNVKDRPKSDDDGTRVKILDEVLRACYVARHIANGQPANGRVFREQVWSARRRFVALLQQEMGKSLRRQTKGKEGVNISPNPALWPEPSHGLTRSLPRPSATARQ